MLQNHKERYFRSDGRENRKKVEREIINIGTIMMDDDADLFFKWVALFGLSSPPFSFPK